MRYLFSGVEDLFDGFDSIFRSFDFHEPEYDDNEVSVSAISTNTEEKYSDKIDAKTLANVNKFVDQYYDEAIKPQLKNFGNVDKFAEEPLKSSYREFLSWVFTQL